MEHIKELRTNRSKARQCNHGVRSGPLKTFQLSKVLVMLRCRLEFGRPTNDVEIHYPGFNLPPYMERGMYETYQNTSEVVVEVRSDGKGGYAWFPYTKKSLVQLATNETIVRCQKRCRKQIDADRS